MQSLSLTRTMFSRLTFLLKGTPTKRFGKPIRIVNLTIPKLLQHFQKPMRQNDVIDPRQRKIVHRIHVRNNNANKPVTYSTIILRFWCCTQQILVRGFKQNCNFLQKANEQSNERNRHLIIHIYN